MTHKEMVVSHYKGRVGLAGEYLLALRLVLEKYEKKDYTVFCPLCDVGSCNDCPWHVLIDSNCDYMQNIASSELSSNFLSSHFLISLLTGLSLVGSEVYTTSWSFAFILAFLNPGAIKVKINFVK